MLIAVYICDNDDNANDEENDDDYAGDDDNKLAMRRSEKIVQFAEGGSKARYWTQVPSNQRR